MPIDQIISHIANTTLEKQQVAQIDGQTGAENTSAEASRRSSTSTQNTDTLTPTNIPSDPTDNQETIVSATSIETVVEAQHNIQDDASNSAFKSYQTSTTHAQTQIQDTIVSAGQASEASKESQEQQDIDMKESGVTKEINAPDVAETSTLTVPTPMRKISRFLVSPVIEQKNIAAEEESSIVGESMDRTNIVAQSTSQSITSITNAELILKNEEHVEANVLEIQSATHELTSNNETIVQSIPYAMEQTDSTQQILQSGQQSIGLQQNIIQMQTLQQVTGQQTTTIGQSNQHTIILQGSTITSQQTSQQIPQTGVQHFVSVNSQELQPQPLHSNGIVQTQAQYPNQAMIQPGVIMQPSQQQIPMQQGIMQMHIQAEQIQQVQRPAVQQFIPQQVQPPTQQYMMLSGHVQPVQPTIMDDRNRRMSNLSTMSNVSTDFQILESPGMVEEKRQGVNAANIPVTHMQHIQVVPQDISGTMLQSAVEATQLPHQNVQHVPATLPPSMPVSASVHPVTAADISIPKVTVKTKEISSTLPDLAQNLANILSNPKSKSATPHPLTSHEPATVPNVAASASVDYKPVQSEQYFQPIQPEVSQLQIQPPIQHNYQGQIVHQGYQGQQNFQQAFQNQQILHQNQVQSQSVPLTIPQQIDAQSQMVQSILQSVSTQSTAQGKWIVTNQTPLQQPIRHIQPNQLQSLSNQLQLQQIPLQPQMHQQIMQDQQHSESSILDQSHLHLKLPEQHAAKPLEIENLESLNSNWYVCLSIPFDSNNAEEEQHNIYVTLICHF